MSGYTTLPKILDEPYFLYVTLNQQYIYMYIFRIKSCISAGEDKNIPVSIDGGKWYALKLEKNQAKYICAI